MDKDTKKNWKTESICSKKTNNEILTELRRRFFECYGTIEKGEKKIFHKIVSENTGGLYSEITIRGFCTRQRFDVDDVDSAAQKHNRHKKRIYLILLLSGQLALYLKKRALQINSLVEQLEITSKKFYDENKSSLSSKITFEQLCKEVESKTGIEFEQTGLN